MIADYFFFFSFFILFFFCVSSVSFVFPFLFLLTLELHSGFFFLLVVIVFYFKCLTFLFLMFLDKNCAQYEFYRIFFFISNRQHESQKNSTHKLFLEMNETKKKKVLSFVVVVFNFLLNYMCDFFFLFRGKVFFGVVFALAPDSFSLFFRFLCSFFNFNSFFGRSNPVNELQCY